jgi:uncharacterized membrane protein YgcG
MFERLLAKRHIASLNLSLIRFKVIERLGWSPEKATQVELEYRRFLYALAHKRPEDTISPPTHEVDEFWHQHILHTRKYRDDCQKVFGQYVDHTPGLNSEEQSKADARRREIYSDSGADFVFFDAGDSGIEHHSSSETSGAHHHGDSGHSGDSHSDGGHSGDGGHGGGDGGSDGGGGGDGGGGCGGGSCGGGGCGG